MAEALLRDVAPDRYDVHSAGTFATAVRPEASTVMAELGIDVSAQTSKVVDRYVGQAWDYVITVCDEANESCPVFPGAGQRMHWSFADPSKATGTDDERLAAYRRVRDEIAERVRAFASDGERA